MTWMRSLPAVLLLVSACGLAGCIGPFKRANDGDAPAAGSGSEGGPTTTQPTDPVDPPEPAPVEEVERVTVQHVLIAHSETDIRGVTRTKQEAEKLALDVLRRARRGESFQRLVRLYSDEVRDDGIYSLVNYGVRTERPEEKQRGDMVRGFGDLAFRLRPLETGLVRFDDMRSPFGWHIIKRLR